VGITIAPFTTPPGKYVSMPRIDVRNIGHLRNSEYDPTGSEIDGAGSDESAGLAGSRRARPPEQPISFARQNDDAVATLDKPVRTIPWMFFSGMAGVTAAGVLRRPAGRAQAPTVAF
jgi:hypothetical protein